MLSKVSSPFEEGRILNIEIDVKRGIEFLRPMNIENIKVYNNKNIYSDKKVAVVDVKCDIEKAQKFATYCIQIQNLIGYNLIEFHDCIKEVDKVKVLVEHDNPKVISQVIELAVEAVNNNLKIEDCQDKILKLKKLTIETELSPNTRLLKNACQKRGIRFTRIGYTDTCILGEGKWAKIFSGLLSDQDFAHLSLTFDRELQKRVLIANGFPAPVFRVVFTQNELMQATKELGFPLAIKGCCKNSPNFINIRTNQQAIEAFNTIKNFESRVVVERFVLGNSYKVLVVNGRVVAAIKRTSPYIVGDGKKKIMELLNEVEKQNKQVQKNILKQGFNLDDILPRGMRLYLKEATNFKNGCIVEDVTEQVAYTNQQLFCDVVQKFGCQFAVLDFVTEDISLPYTTIGGYIVDIETNSDLRIFSQNCNVDVYGTILDVYFEKMSNPSVPIIAVSGTFGKSTTVQIVRYILQRCGVEATIDSDINNFYLRNISDTSDIKLIEFNPSAQIEEIEIEPCVGIITNTLDENQIERNMLFSRSIKENGYLILNVNDPFKYLYSSKAKCQIVFTSPKFDHPDLMAHIELKKPCVYLEDDTITIFDGKETFKFCSVKEIPYSYDGKLKFAIENILQVVAALYFYGVDPEIIYRFLIEYKNDSHQNPGKFNIFDINGVKVIIDDIQKKEHIKIVIENLEQIGICKLLFVCDSTKKDLIDFVEDKERVVCKDIKVFGDVVELISTAMRRAKKGEGVFIILPEPLNKDITYEIRESLARRKKNFVNNA